MGDVLSRLSAAPIAALFPSRREPALRRWVQWNRKLILGVLRAAGARLDIQARIPCEGGILIVMNHQSLVDVPIVFACVPDGYPRMVTHHRYSRGVPLVSHMIRTYGHISVYPGRTGRTEFDALSATARTAQHPIAIYPEGHRTRDGEIRPWKRGAMDAFLSAREWRVYVVVVDGLWRSARVSDFMRNISTVRCRVESVGPFEYDGRGRASHDEFVGKLHAAMCAKLADMRGATRSSSSIERPPAGSVTSP